MNGLCLLIFHTNLSHRRILPDTYFLYLHLCPDSTSTRKTWYTVVLCGCSRLIPSRKWELNQKRSVVLGFRWKAYRAPSCNSQKTLNGTICHRKWKPVAKLKLNVARCKQDGGSRGRSCMHWRKEAQPKSSSQRADKPHHT